VLSLFILLGAGTTPIGGLLIGTLSDKFGVSWALAVCSALCIVGVVVGFVYRKVAGEQVENAPNSLDGA